MYYLGRQYGDGVNIAARLENLAEAGGICISGTVFDQIENKLNLNIVFFGEKSVKTIPKPVRIYKIHLDSKKPSSHIERSNKIRRIY